MKTRLLVLLLCAGFFSFGRLAVSDDRADAAKDAQPARQQPDVVGEPKALEKSVRLEFKLQGFPNDPAFFVVCGAGDYSLRYAITKPDTEFSVRIEGAVRPANQAGRLLLTFKSELQIAKPNDGNQGQFSVSGGSLIEPGKPKRLATLGDGTLTVTATLED
jgi:hypothetical protein